MSDFDDDDIEEQPDRRPRGWLAADIKSVCDLYITGELKIKDDKPLTPYRCALAVKEVDGLDEAPSVGAVSAVFKRWDNMGFATFRTDPFAFVEYTEEGKQLGLQRMMELHRARRSDSRSSGKVPAGQSDT